LPNFIAPPMVVDPLRSTTLYAGSVGGVVYSTDGGKSWASLGGLGGSTLVIDPTTGSTLYAVAGGESLSDGTPAGDVLVLQVVEPLPLPILAAFESPEDDQPVSGIGVVRGWAFPTRSDHTLSPAPVFVVDGGKGGSYFRSLSCCSERLDVQAAFPQFPAAQTGQSGWGGLFNWGSLSAGSHTLRVALSSGDSIGYPSQLVPPFRTVTVVKPGDFEFLDRFDLGQAQASINGNELALTGVVVRDVFSHQQKRINVHFRWFTNLQSLGMVRSETVATVASWSNLSRMLTAVASRVWRGVEVVTPVQAASAIASYWESPNEGQAVSGIGILRGWAFADEPPFNPRRPLPSIQDVVVRVDGAPIAKVFCCAERDDVMVAFPEHENAFQSGWALQFNYGNLSAGSHTISVQLHPASENVPSEIFHRTVQVIRIGGFSFLDQFALADATARIEGEEIVLSGVQVRDKASQQTKVIEVRLRWFQHSQALGIVASS
jgi:hypothetical protein